MSEENKTPQTEKSGFDEARKSALLRYVAILFAVAFLLVLVSLLGQVRNSKSAITELSQSSTSAIQRAEQLQEDNQFLTKDNEELTAANEELTQDKKFLQQQVEQLTERTESLQEEAEAQQKLQEAYEALLAAMETGNTDNLEQYKDILGENGMKAYETLTKEVE